MLDLLRATHHNLLRNKLRTFLTVLAIFIGSFTIILNVAINTGVDSFITDQIESLGGEDFILIASEDTLDSLSSTLTSSSEPVPYNPNQTLSALTDDQLAELKSIDGLIADSFTVTRSLSVEYISRPDDGQKYLITAQALPAGDFHISLSAGRLPDQSTDAYEITLQSGYPEALGFASDEAAINQTVTLPSAPPLPTPSTPKTPNTTHPPKPMPPTSSKPVLTPPASPKPKSNKPWKTTATPVLPSPTLWVWFAPSLTSSWSSSLSSVASPCSLPPSASSTPSICPLRNALAKSA